MATNKTKVELEQELAEVKANYEKLKEITTVAVEETAPSKAADNLPEVAVPHSFRQIVDSVLNSNFDIRISYDQPGMFFFQIIVPERYRSVSDSYMQLMHEEVHCKQIPIHLSDNGVREYTELVFKSFNVDLQALITADRLTMNH